jgi:hypothetical protein
MADHGFNKRRMEGERAAVAAKEAEARRTLGPQILKDAEQLVLAWNGRQEGHMPMLFSPTIGAAFWRPDLDLNQDKRLCTAPA